MSAQAASTSYTRYSDSLETIEPDEQETFEKIAALMSHGADTVREKDHHPVRISHAKAHGAVRGTLTVESNLPEPLRQGLFAESGKRYDVIVRLAHTPGELTDDRKVSVPRGIAIKVLGAKGEKISGHTGDTQDFVFDTGKIFIVPGAKSFLQAFKPNAEIAPHLSDTTKGVVSSVARGSNAVLHAVGLDSSQLDFFGHPFLHPLAECYYSQTPYRYGDYVAKFEVAPATPGLKELEGKTFEPHGENGLRVDVVDFFRTHDAEYVFGAQLMTDPKIMPVENANAEWPEKESPYQPIARLSFPAQDAYSEAASKYVDGLSFCPSHALAEHRPLGSLNRSRIYAYRALSAKRRGELGVPQAEPESIDSFPA